MTWHQEGAIAAACLLGAAVAAGAAEPRTCRYEVTVWNVRARRSLRRAEVAKPYADLSPAERGPEGCTPCREDQEEVALSNGVRFRACRRLAARLRRALESALAEGQAIEAVLGYHPQMSRGEPDERGERTRLSNHSFGAAVDVSPGHNGLYEDCVAWSPGCRLRKGGAYRPGEDPLSLPEDGVLVREMGKAGLRWGGRLPGRQKDFMHFSPSGD